MKTQIEDINRNIYDIKNKDDYDFKMQSGINEEIVREMIEKQKDSQCQSYGIEQFHKSRATWFLPHKCSVQLSKHFFHIHIVVVSHHRNSCSKKACGTDK